MRMFLAARVSPLVLIPLGLLIAASSPVQAQTVISSGPAKDPHTTQISRSAPPLPVRKPVQSLADLKAQLDRNDQLIAMRALHMALSQVPDGGTFVWRKNSRSLKGLIKPTRAFRNAQGQVCRHLIYALSLGRYIKQIEGIACRTGDGSWHL